MKVLHRCLAVLTLALAAPWPARAEVTELKITKQPSIIYLPAILMEHDHLIEKQARKMGLGDLKVQWLTFSSGGASMDALLAGQIQMVCAGTTNMLVMWDKTHGTVKGVAGAAATPLLLVSRDPAVHTLKDFTDKDKIAVPTVKVSTQAILLQMAARQAFGKEGEHRLDRLTVTRGHPDALIALSTTNSEINAHFSAPPYQQQELKLPGAHLVLDSNKVMGGPGSNATFFATTRFHDANPKTLAAFRAALEEAEQIIQKHPLQAARKYLEVTHEKYSVDELVSIIHAPGTYYSMTPYGTYQFASFMHQAGLLKHKLTNWKEAYFPEAAHLPGS